MERMHMIRRLGRTFWPGMFLGVILGLVICVSSAGAADQLNWKELKGTHFIVYFTGEESFARDALNNAEKYYTRIANELGYARYQDFWTWEKRCKIYVYPDHDSFLKSTGGAEWSHGLADYRAKTIISYAWHEGFLDSLLPHEIAHLIFRDFIGFKGEVPLWLDEGVAQWEEEAKRPQMKAMIKELYDNEGLLLINDMMKLDIRRLKSKDGVHVRSALTKDGSPGVVFLSSDNLVNTYYLQSVSMIGFLIEKYGGESFTNFCRELRDGETLQEALKSAYMTITTIEEFEKRWKEYLDQL